MSETIETPKTSAAAQQSIDLLAACKCAADFQVAVKAIVADLLALSKKLETENRQFRNGCSQIAANLGNGSAASPDASVGFLTDGLAREVKLYCEHLRREATTPKPHPTP
jgi:hypothetical protein